MLLPSELNRLRDLATTNADAIADVARPRSLIVAKAPAMTYTSASTIFELVRAAFTDRQGYSGLQRGDLVRGELFGVYTSNTGGPGSQPELRVLFGAATVAHLRLSIADLGGNTVSWRYSFVLRIDGGEDQTINSPSKSSEALIFAAQDFVLGDTGLVPGSVSQLVASHHTTSTDPTTAFSVSLSQPITVSVMYNPDTDTQLTVYGGVMEGL